jgi:hypothetical protein
LDGFKVLLDMFVVQNLLQEYCWGCLVGHPYIASLWLAPKRVLCLSLSFSVCCQATSSFLGFRLTKGLKDPFVIYAPILVFEGGQCYTRHFVLYIMDPIQIISNIHVLKYKNMRLKYFMGPFFKTFWHLISY